MPIEDLPFESKVRRVFEESDASHSQFKSEFLESKYSNSLIGVDSENLTFQTLSDECGLTGLIISDHTQQTVAINGDQFWSLNSCEVIVHARSTLRNTFYPEYKYT